MATGVVYAGCLFLRLLSQRVAATTISTTNAVLARGTTHPTTTSKPTLISTGLCSKTARAGITI